MKYYKTKSLSTLDVKKYNINIKHIFGVLERGDSLIFVYNALNIVEAISVHVGIWFCSQKRIILLFDISVEGIVDADI